jgi:hypothetical protein
MADQINEFNVWQDNAPVVNLAPNQEFDIWQDNAPVANIDESAGVPPPIPPITSLRRRAFIF